MLFLTRLVSPLDLALPMMAPHDLGVRAAKLLIVTTEETGLHYVEGPRHYSSADVAEAFSAALGKPEVVVQTPRA